jgi:hypothetical protein
MALFSLILEFDGGTYVEQVRSADANSAIKSWSAVFADQNLLGRRTKNFLAKFHDYSCDVGLIPLDDRLSIWYFRFLVGRKTAWGHLVETADTR